MEQIGGRNMRTIWKIYDNYHSKMLDSEYKTEQAANEAMERAILGRKSRKESYDFDVVEAEYAVKNEYIHDLRCDLDRLDYYTHKGNNDKIDDYMKLIVEHVREMLETSDEF